MRILAKRPLTPEERKEALEGWLEKTGVYRAADKPVTVLEEEPYSEYMLGGKTTLDTIKRAYKLGTDMLIGMSLPKRPVIRLDNKAHKTALDGVNIVVGTKVFDDEELDTGEKLDVFLGNVVHEGAHVKYGDVLAKPINKLHGLITKILADEYVERKVAEELPGFIPFVEKRRKYYYDKAYGKAIEELDEKETVVTAEGEMKEEKGGPLTKFLEILTKIVRYPEFLKEKEIDELGDRLLALKRALVPFACGIEEVKTAAKEVYEIIKDLVTEEMAHDLDHEEEKMKKRGAPPVIVLVLEKEAAKKLEEMFEEAVEELSGEEVEALIDGGAGVCVALLVDPFAVAIMEGDMERGDKDVFFMKEGDNERVYRESYARIERYIPAFGKELVLRGMEMRYTERGMRSGNLDTSKLVEGRLGVETIYIREGVRQTSELLVVIGIDESGSMGRGNPVASIESARDMAVLLNEVLKKIPNIKYVIYGHTADNLVDGSTSIYVYREPGYAPRFSLGSIDARDNNRDGVAIWNMALRARTFSQAPGLMWMLSDGSPSAEGYHGTAHTKKMVQQVQNALNMQVMQIAINKHFDPATMFDHYVVFEDLSKLAMNVGKMVRKAIAKNTVVRFTS